MCDIIISIGEIIMEMDKKNVVNGAMEFAKYMTEQIPQKDTNGNATYYFSGSLAMLLLSSANSITPAVLDKDGKVVSIQETMSIQEEHKENLSQGIRPLTGDVDIVCVDDNIFAGKGNIFTKNNIQQHCSCSNLLCPAWGKSSISKINTDLLSGDRTFSFYDVAELILEDGSIVIIADPLALICHKFADGISCLSAVNRLKQKGILRPEKEQELIQKYQKDIHDLTSMFNGVISLYPNIQFAELIENVLQNCDKTAFSSMMCNNSCDKIIKLCADCIGQINDENKDLFYNFVNAIGIKNKAILENQNSSTPSQ